MIKKLNDYCGRHFCQCDTIYKVFREQSEWKVWYICSTCNKPVKWSDRYYHYYDGEMRLEPDRMGLERLYIND